MDKKEVKGKIVDLMKYAEKKKGRKPQQSDDPGNISLTQSGRGNIQTGRDYNHTGDINNYTTKKVNKTIGPSPGSIGYDPLLKNRIKTLVDEIGDERKKRFGPSAYSVVAKQIRSKFKIKKGEKWTVIWLWPRECAEEIIEFLEDLYGETIGGRIKKAASRKNYMHTRPQLYRIEKELLSHLGLKLDSKEVKVLLKEYFGVTSHTKLTHNQHWQLVRFFEDQVDKIEKS
jgi:hypothetical protein